MDLSLKTEGQQSKQNLRKYYLSLRKSLSGSFVEEASLSIGKKLLNIEQFKKSEVIHCYVSIPANNEVDTDSIIHHCFRFGKKVILPKVADNGGLTHHPVVSLQHLKPNGWGVPEPETSEEWPTDQIDCIIVPMVAGDRMRNRIGYGKGYYDKFLANVKCFKIGILYDCQLYPKTLPVETFDVKMDIMITEKEVIS